MKKQQTAVQWLVKELNIQAMGATIATALAKEKLQIVKAHGHTLKQSKTISKDEYWSSGEQYYKNNYENNDSR
jgi:hypothetical protein